MTPIFLHHQAMDLFGVIETGLPSKDAVKARRRLCSIRDLAVSSGAHVLIVLWQDLEWTLLAIQPPADVEINDARELIPRLLRNPEALEQMRQRSLEGNHMQWLMLTRPGAFKH